MKIRSLFATLACALVMGSVAVSARWVHDSSGKQTNEYCKPSGKYTHSGYVYACFIFVQSIADAIQRYPSSGVVGPLYIVLFSDENGLALRTERYTLSFDVSSRRTGRSDTCNTLLIRNNGDLSKVVDTRKFCPETGPRVFPVYAL